MNKISITISSQFVIFSKPKKTSFLSSFNGQNLKTVMNMEFSEEYIRKNASKIIANLKDKTKKYKIDWAIINDMDVAEIALDVINNIENITNISFLEDKELTYTITSLLLENKYINKIYCYNIPQVMYNQFYDSKIETRCSLNYHSNFMKYNEINSYAKLYQREKINIIGEISDNDLEDLEFILKSNLRIKSIVFYEYDKTTLTRLAVLLTKINMSNVNIEIMEYHTITKKIFRDIEFIKKLNKKFKFNIIIKYSKQYKEKNKFKQLNLNMFKYCALGIAVCCAIYIGIYYYKDYFSGKDMVENIDRINKISETMDNLTIEENLGVDMNVISSEEQKEKNPYEIAYSEVYDDLLKLNEDTVGWIKVNDTNINYPVVQSEDNDYYLRRAFDRNKNKAGWIYADYRNSFNELSDNTIIYGHALKNGNMFGTLKNVLEPSWYNNADNLTITFNVKDKPLKWQIFSIYTLKETNDYLVSDFTTKESFMNYIEMFKERSIKDFGVNIEKEDKIITLTSCYISSANRLVVHAKLITNN